MLACDSSKLVSKGDPMAARDPARRRESARIAALSRWSNPDATNGRGKPGWRRHLADVDPAITDPAERERHARAAWAEAVERARLERYATRAEAARQQLAAIEQAGGRGPAATTASPRTV